MHICTQYHSDAIRQQAKLHLQELSEAHCWFQIRF